MNKFKKIFLSFLLSCLIISSVFATEVQNINQPVKQDTVLTLEKCIDIAIQNNPNIGLAKNTTKVYQSKIGQVKSSYFPQVSVSSGYNRQNSITNSNRDDSNNQYSGNVGISQLVYDFGKTPTKAKIQTLNLTASKTDIKNTVIQVAYNVKQAYYSALSAKISRDIYNQTIKQNEQHLKQAKAFFEAGIKSKIDVTTANVNLSNSKLNYIKADNVYKTSIANLNNAMGTPEAPAYDIADTLSFKHTNDSENEIKTASKDNSLNKIDDKSVLKSKISKYDLIEDLTFKKQDISFEESLKTAYNNRPDLKSLVTKGAAANESIKLAKKDYLPTLSGVANYGFGGQEFPLDNGWSLGANINIPVFNGFLTKNQVNEAKANLDIAKSDIEILKQNIYLQVQQAYINLTESEKRIPVTDVVVKQAKENLDLANGRYKVGVGNSIEVQDAEINYNNAQLSYVQALYDYNIAHSNLEKAMGVK